MSTAEASINQDEAVNQGLSILQQYDQTSQFEIVPDDVVDVKATRWLFAAGNTLTRQRIKQTGFKYGGLDVANRCLKRTAWGNGNYLPRLTFTPMELWFEPMADVHLAGAVSNGFGQTMTIADSRGNPAPVPPGMEGYYKNALQRVISYPGHEIRMITTSANTSRICEVELKALIGVTYESGIAQQIESLFFPRDFLEQALVGEIPQAMVRRRIEEIRYRALEGASKSPNMAEMVQSCGDDMLESCDLFDGWANKMIGENHSQLRQRTKHEHTFSYSPLVVESLLAQMGVARQDTSTLPMKDSGSADLAQILAERDEIAEKRYEEQRAENLKLQMQLAEMQAQTAESNAAFIEFLKSETAKNNRPPQAGGNQPRK